MKTEYSYRNFCTTLVALTLLAFGTTPVRAEDVYVTSYISTGVNTCAPSCPYDLGVTAPAFCISSACSVSRAHCMFGSTNTAVWKITPTLANNHGTYKIFVTKGPADDCSPDIIVNMTATGGTLADASGAAQTTVPTTAFQKPNSTNTWTLVGYIINNTNQPDVFFTYASGSISPTARFYMDAVNFQSVAVIGNPAPPARITQILYGNPVTIAGTGPVGHSFALVSSTNAAKALNQWTPELTNTAGSGTFNFSLTPGPAPTMFFRVLTQ